MGSSLFGCELKVVFVLCVPALLLLKVVWVLKWSVLEVKFVGGKWCLGGWTGLMFCVMLVVGCCGCSSFCRLCWMCLVECLV